MIKAHNLTLLYICICFGIAVVSYVGIGGPLLSGLSSHWNEILSTQGPGGLLYTYGPVAIMGLILGASLIGNLLSKAPMGAAISLYGAIFFGLYMIANLTLLGIDLPGFAIFVDFFAFIGFIVFINDYLSMARGVQ